MDLRIVKRITNGQFKLSRGIETVLWEMWRKRCSWVKLSCKTRKNVKDYTHTKFKRRRIAMNGRRAQNRSVSLRMTRRSWKQTSDSFRDSCFSLLIISLMSQKTLESRRCQSLPKKNMIWQASCSCGKRSTPFVTTGTINGPPKASTSTSKVTQ